MQAIANEDRDEITYDFIDNLSDRLHEQWTVFLEGFGAAFKMSGLTHMPCDVTMIFDSYMEFVKKRLDEEGWTDEPADRRSEQRKWLGHAVMLVRDFPSWSNARIAREVGKHPSTLCRSSEFQAVADQYRNGTGDKEGE